MRPDRPVTLLTDFGQDDTYVGQMKGVIARGLPGTPTIDLTHAVAAQDVDQGAYLLETAVEAFPPETIHVAVVDPGVGTDRRALLLRAGAQWLIGPDNGLLLRAAQRLGTVEAWEIADQVAAPNVAPTFHGRDLFAPAAVALRIRGAAAVQGAKVDPVALIGAAHRREAATGPRPVRVLHVDRFGNLALDLRGAEADPQAELELADGTRLRRWVRTFGEVEDGQAALLINSADYVEIVVPRDRADRRLGLQRGMTVYWRPSPGRLP